MAYDFNLLERRARKFMESNQPEKALRIYFFMTDGDLSLDGGYLGKKIAECYEALKISYAAKYWYGKAFSENPEARRDCQEAQHRLEKVVNIADLVKP